MNIYNFLSRISLLKKYSYKFLFVAFLGIHVPLISLIVFIVISGQSTLSPATILLITLAFTLLATGCTLYVLNQLLAPLSQSKMALESYLDRGTLPSLPLGHEDEAGVLMTKLQTTIVTLDKVLRSKDDMVSLLSHDIRVPLGHMINYAEMLKIQPESAASQGFPDKIIEAGNRQLQLLENMLALLKHQDGEIEREDMTRVSAYELVEQTLSSLQDIIDEKQLKTVNLVPESLSLHVEPDLFGQAFHNILHNACKFSHSGGVIRIHGSERDGMSCLAVEDEGIGFPADQQAELFRRFTDSGQTGTSGEQSTGLGLYLTKGIIQRHNGRITSHSDGKGKGARFEIVIPGQ